MSIAFICPTYNARELQPYTLRALRSFFQHSPDESIAIVIDDASPDWGEDLVEEMIATIRIKEYQGLAWTHCPEWGGLTRSWNAGMHTGRPADYIIAGNNDIVFSPGWWKPLVDALEAGYDMVGPVSNAPGVTGDGKALVSLYLPPGYKPDDSDEAIAATAEQLKRHSGEIVEAPVNGFFQFAKSDTWWSGAYDERHVFRPRNDFNSKGQPNPTPLMTLNEDELRGRWLKMGRRFGIVPESFIFHYRAVSRGDKFRHGQWARMVNRSGK